MVKGIGWVFLTLGFIGLALLMYSGYTIFQYEGKSPGQNLSPDYLIFMSAVAVEAGLFSFLGFKQLNQPDYLLSQSILLSGYFFIWMLGIFPWFYLSRPDSIPLQVILSLVGILIFRKVIIKSESKSFGFLLKGNISLGVTLIALIIFRIGQAVFW